MADSPKIAQRKSDPNAIVRYRSDRFFKNGGRWFFETREGKVQGPFDSRSEAEQHLEAYVRVESLDIYEGSDFSLQPKDP